MTEKNYFSQFTPEPTAISVAQFITEQICLKKAQSEGRSLPIRFWDFEIWSKYFRNQIASANALLKKYHEKDILAALRDYRAAKIYSLRNKRLVKLIEEKWAERSKGCGVIEHIEHIEQEQSSPAKPFGKQSLMDKLRQNDDESPNIFTPADIWEKEE